MTRRDDGDPAIQRSASDPRDVARGENLSEKRAERELDAWAALLRGKASASEGRWVLAQILEYCKLNEDPFRPDAAQTAFNLGVQKVGRHISARLALANEDGFFLMQREARIRARAEALENEAGRPPRDEEPTGDEVFRQ